MIDLDDNRLEVAKRFGATTTISSDGKAQGAAMKMSGKRGADTATVPILVKTVGSREIDPGLPVAHHLRLRHILDACETSGQVAEQLKVIV
jgi:threonine dehydrogenase-like Zn-dependent dehydrogenase